MTNLVAGPPCGGKTTFVKARALAHESILDFDDIVEQLTGDRYAERTPDLVSRARQQWKASLPTADWVIWTAPRRADRGRFRVQYNAQVYVVMAPQSVCLERAKAERPPSWEAAIRRWFANCRSVCRGRGCWVCHRGCGRVCVVYRTASIKP